MLGKSNYFEGIFEFWFYFFILWERGFIESRNFNIFFEFCIYYVFLSFGELERILRVIKGFFFGLDIFGFRVKECEYI